MNFNVKIKYISRKVLAISILGFFLHGLILLPRVAAQAKGYFTDDSGLKAGMVVAISESSSAQTPKVERAALDKDSKVIGVSTTPDDQLTIAASGDSQVYVQDSGEAFVLVSDLNGKIENGDLLAPSPLLGIMMKADDGTAPIVGISLENFDSSNAETKSIEENNQSKQVKIGMIRVNLDHMAASNQQASATDSSLERLGRAVVGRDVGELQVISAAVIFLIVLITEGAIVYGAISSAITAVGRNPLAQKFIQGELIRVILVAIIVLLVGMGAIYAILWI